MGFLAMKYFIFSVVVLLCSCSSNFPEKSQQVSLGEIAKNFNGEILIPGEVPSDFWADVGEGFQFAYRIHGGLSDPYIDKFVFSHKKENIYFFRRFWDEEERPMIAFINGSLHKVTGGSVVKNSDKSNCLNSIDIGSCEFVVVKTKRVMDIRFVDGVWERNWISQGLSGKSTIKTVYDKKGLILYKKTVFENKLQGVYRSFITERVE